MLDDRDYMRQPEYHAPRVSATVLLLMVNAVVFLVQLASAHFSAGGQYIQDRYFALSLDGIKHGYFWQLLTFQFMHSTVWWLHIVFNSLAIYFFGRPVELVLGRARFLGLYFVSGIIGGIVQLLFMLATHSDAGVVGASAGASGLVAAFAVIHWREEFTLLFYFFPINLRGRTLFWITIGMAVIGMMMPSSTIANAAHLGGVLAGFFYARQILRGGWPQWNFSRFFHRREKPQPREYAATRARENKFWRSAPPAEELNEDEFVQSQVDPILDKISAHGIQSLTRREREILESARKKMTRR